MDKVSCNMKKALLILIMVLGCSAFLSAKKRVKNLYTLPPDKNTATSKAQVPMAPLSDRTFLVGNAHGLFKVTIDNKAIPIWTGGTIEQILNIEVIKEVPDKDASTANIVAQNATNALARTQSGAQNDTLQNGFIGDSSALGTANTNSSNILASYPKDSSLNIATNGIDDTANGSQSATTKKRVSAWLFRSSAGVLYSEDLETFSLRNEGLPQLVIKEYSEEKGETFHPVIHTLKDLAADPFDNNRLITATKDCVYLSEDCGLTWKNIGSMSANTSGIKAVAVTTIKGRPATDTQKATVDEVVAFESHPIFGFAYKRLSTARPAWIDVSAGFDLMTSMTQIDEISDILPVKKVNADGSIETAIYCAQSYIPRIYRFDWEDRRAVRLYKGEAFNGTIDGLSIVDGSLLYSTVDNLGSLNPETLQSPGVPQKLETWKRALKSAGGVPNCAWVPKTQSGFNQNVLLNELWLLFSGTINTPYAEAADGKKCVYASAYQCREQKGIDKFRKIIHDNGLNALVIDMKDDYGLLRYQTKDPYVLKMAKVTQYKVDLDHFVEEFKKDGVYLVARIVVFKDRNLSNIEGNKYAIWNKKTNTKWIGIRGYIDTTDDEGEVIGSTADYYDEEWVDPYCPIVWQYNTAIAKELIARGFDEVQFDYIRFPTDGLNMGSASYRWQSKGMDKEAALTSFLSYARKNIDAPIGIDIYGANGWYRSGTRTGQDVEMLCEYVDVIGPMFYPSHFEQGFLDCAPRDDRTYRIYYYGTYRNTIMARNRVIVRPWVQAFRLNVSYDREFYNKEYVIKQVFGVRDSVDRGYMYWNNAGNYETISRDVGPGDVYIGTTPESRARPSPTIGKEKATLDRQSATQGDESLTQTPSEKKALDALDTIYYNRKRDTSLNSSASKNKTDNKQLPPQASYQTIKFSAPKSVSNNLCVILECEKVGEKGLPLAPCAPLLANFTKDFSSKRAFTPKDLCNTPFVQVIQTPSEGSTAFESTSCAFSTSNPLCHSFYGPALFAQKANFSFYTFFSQSPFSSKVACAFRDYSASNYFYTCAPYAKRISSTITLSSAG